jgi:hypothetical protein
VAPAVAPGRIPAVGTGASPAPAPRPNSSNRPGN